MTTAAETDWALLASQAWATASLSPWHFSQIFARTLDQHDTGQPVKRFPNRPHLRALCELWASNRLLFIEKSRQMLVTWWASMLALWCVLFRRGQLIFLQSKRLEDVVGNEYTGDGLLGRAKFLLAHMPFRAYVLPPLGIVSNAESITVRANDSAIQAIPQGGDKIRSHTVTGLISDETAIQEEFAEAFSASMASIRRGWAVWITTPHLVDGGQSMRVCRNLPEEAPG